MINENINVGIKLSGEYRFSILEDNKVVSTSDWRSNTILSGGLVDLYTHDIPTVMSNLDLGLSTSLAGLSGYGLSGVVVPSEFINVYRDVNEIYQEDVSSKIYYSTFTTNRATSAVTLNEFAIKRGANTTAFARNTFSTGYDIKVNQYVNFEYRLTLNWDYITTSNIAVTGNNSTYTYTIPSTTKNYNIPYDRVFYNNNYLALLGDIRDLDAAGNYNVTTRLPNMGEDFPLYYDWGIQGEITSVYTPTTILTSIDNTNKRFNVSTRYNNITCYPNSGVFSNIKNAILVADGNFNNSVGKFNITQFEYPLTVYNDAYNYADGVLLVNDTYKYNTLALTYNYSWYECPSLKDTDYLILTYEFTAENGVDLDIDVSIVSPVNTFPVGYCYVSEYNNNNYPNDRNYIVWSGDNVGTGVESVYINVKNIRLDYPDTTQINIGSLVKWWNARYNGYIAIRATAWKGGTMNLDGYQFNNNGGVELNNFTFPTQYIDSVGSDCSNFESTGALVYDMTTGILTKLPV